MSIKRLLLLGFFSLTISCGSLPWEKKGGGGGGEPSEAPTEQTDGTPNTDPNTASNPTPDNTQEPDGGVGIACVDGKKGKKGKGAMLQGSEETYLYQDEDGYYLADEDYEDDYAYSLTGKKKKNKGDEDADAEDMAEMDDNKDEVCEEMADDMADAADDADPAAEEEKKGKKGKKGKGKDADVDDDN